MAIPTALPTPDPVGLWWTQPLQFHQIRGDRAFCCVIYGSFLALPKKDRIRTSATSHKETYFHARQKEQIGRGSTNWHQMDRPANHAHIKLPLLRQHRGEVRDARNCMREQHQ